MTDTLMSAFAETVAHIPYGVAAHYKVNSQWLGRSWLQQWQEITRFAGGLCDLGLQKGEVVAIISSNRREWATAYFAAMAAGCVPVGINSRPPSPGGYAELLLACGASCVVVENQVQLNKLGDPPGPPLIKGVVLMDGRPCHPQVTSWHLLLRRGREHEEEIAARLAGLTPQDRACLYFPRPHPCPPKSLSHRSLLTLGRDFVGQLPGPLTPADTYLSYRGLDSLPEQLSTMVASALFGVQVYFGESKAAVWDDLRCVRPTLLAADPSLCQHLRRKIEVEAARALSPEAALLAWGPFKAHAQRGILAQTLLGPPLSILAGIAARLVKRELGLERCRLMFSPASHLSRDATTLLVALGLAPAHNSLTPEFVA